MAGCVVAAAVPCRVAADIAAAVTESAAKSSAAGVAGNSSMPAFASVSGMDGLWSSSMLEVTLCMPFGRGPCAVAESCCLPSGMAAARDDSGWPCADTVPTSSVAGGCIGCDASSAPWTDPTACPVCSSELLVLVAALHVSFASSLLLDLCVVRP